MLVRFTSPFESSSLMSMGLVDSIMCYCVMCSICFVFLGFDTKTTNFKNKQTLLFSLCLKSVVKQAVATANTVTENKHCIVFMYEFGN